MKPNLSGFPNYHVTENGEIWRLPRKGSTRLTKRKLQLSDQGYLLVNLPRHSSFEVFFIHRLVALAYVPNTDTSKFDRINHIDEDKTNNQYTNLEWTDSKGNGRHSLSKAIVQLTLEGEYIKDWISAGAAADYLHLNATLIRATARGVQNQSGGYRWVYLS